jgi:hypothetical protein
LFHLLNTSRMPQIDAASGCERPWERGDQISKGSGLYRVRSSDEYGGMGQMGRNKAAGLKNAMRGTFWDRVVNGTIGRGHGRVWGPVEVIVSALDTQVVRLDVLMNWTY